MKPLNMAASAPYSAQEAASRVCPMSMGGALGSALCIGPRCMAWRWGGDHPEPRTLGAWDRDSVELPADRPPGVGPNWTFQPAKGLSSKAVWIEDEASFLARAVGLCGMVSP